MFDRVYLHGAHLHSLKCHFPNSLASNMSMEVHVTQGFMNAVLLRGYGDLTHLSYEEVPIPVPAAGEFDDESDTCSGAGRTDSRPPAGCTAEVLTLR